MYKTSHFRDIKEIEVESFTEYTVDVKRSSLMSLSTFQSDRIITVSRNGSQNAYHETMLDAKNYVLMQLSDKITKMELDLKKYKKLVSKFQ